MRPVDADAVFQLSLVEIAFILVFILLILAGWMYQHSGEEHGETFARPQESGAREARPHDAQGVFDETGAAALQKRVDDLETQLSALAEVKAVMDEAGKSMARMATEAALRSALELRTKLEEKILVPGGGKSGGARQISDRDLAEQTMAALELRQQLDRALGGLGLSIASGQEAAWARDLVAAHVEKATGSRENADLRGQVAFLLSRLEAQGERYFPPCWADEHSGRVQFLFNLELRPNLIAVTPAWPPVREMDAIMLPGMNELLARSPHAHATFQERAQGIFQHGNARRCRHYVQLRNRITDAANAEQAQSMVEALFHKAEAR
jgi:hypothetical protein